MQRYDIHLFVEDRRFRLQDDDAAAIDAIVVHPSLEGEIAVSIELHESRPDIDSGGWAHVDSASLRIASGRMVVASSTEYFPEAFRIPMRRGTYEALVCHTDDRYLVALYPAAATGARGELHVIRLDATHVAPYRAFMLRAYAEAPDAFTSTPEERAREPESWWVKRVADASGSSAAYGCFDGGALIGTVAVEFSSKPKTRHKAHLIGMFVVPEARGRGAARMLVDAAIGHCRARGGITSITLTVTDGNQPAIALYRKAGFRGFGVEPMALRTPEGYLSKMHMQLTLEAEL
jgi:ribosomal protein S18 acetylase RimI-like enzyme